MSPCYGSDKFETSIDVKQYKPEEIVVKVVGDTIKIVGKHLETNGETKYVSRQFSRSFTLNDNYNLEKIQTSINASGLLIVRVPAHESIAQQQQLQIQQQQQQVQQQNQQQQQQIQQQQQQIQQQQQQQSVESRTCTKSTQEQVSVSQTSQTSQTRQQNSALTSTRDTKEYVVPIQNQETIKSIQEQQINKQTDTTVQKTDDSETATYQIDVQNYSPEEVVVKVIGDTVTVEGKHVETVGNTSFVSRQFFQEYTLNSTYNMEKIEHKIISGVLTIKVPKKSGPDGAPKQIANKQTTTRQENEEYSVTVSESDDNLSIRSLPLSQTSDRTVTNEECVRKNQAQQNVSKNTTTSTTTEEHVEYHEVQKTNNAKKQTNLSRKESEEYLVTMESDDNQSVCSTKDTKEHFVPIKEEVNKQTVTTQQTQKVQKPFEDRLTKNVRTESQEYSETVIESEVISGNQAPVKRNVDQQTIQNQQQTNVVQKTNTTIANPEYGPDKFETTIDVQEYRPEEVKVRVTGDTITIEGKHEETDGQTTYVARQFVKKYTLTKNYNLEKAESKITSAGVLVVKVPALESIEQQKQKNVESKTSTRTTEEHVTVSQVQESKQNVQNVQQNAALTSTKEHFVPISQSKDQHTVRNEQLVKENQTKTTVQQNNTSTAVQKTSDTDACYQINVQQYTPEEVVVKVVGDTITIEAKHVETVGNTSFVSRQFFQQYTLNSNYNLQKIQHNITSNGILNIRVPMKDEQSLKASRNDQLSSVQNQVCQQQNSQVKSTSTSTSEHVEYREVQTRGHITSSSSIDRAEEKSHKTEVLFNV